jgi:hypothetical protein
MPVRNFTGAGMCAAYHRRECSVGSVRERAPGCSRTQRRRRRRRRQVIIEGGGGAPISHGSRVSTRVRGGARTRARSRARTPPPAARCGPDYRPRLGPSGTQRCGPPPALAAVRVCAACAGAARRAAGKCSRWLVGAWGTGGGGVGGVQVSRGAPETAQVLRYRQLPPRFFGEGVTVLGDRIYQLTWTSRLGCSLPRPPVCPELALDSPSRRSSRGKQASPRLSLSVSLLCPHGDA